MSLMDYESDSLGGLMPQILALTAPPGTRDNRQPLQQSSSNPSSQLNCVDNNLTKPNESGLAAHPYFKRPGKGHNHDCCDACSEGGDLICCDSCPASFHLTCHDPPLDEDELPTGDWACHQCRMGGSGGEKLPTLNNNNINVNLKPNKTVKAGGKKKEKVESKGKEESERKIIAGGREMVISDTPLATLIKAVAVMNPTQFSLPYEMTLPSAFPGEPKETMIRKFAPKKGLNKKKPYELDNGLVPLPAKLCFQCNKSCRTGPMIPCDYCPLFFHLDCLDPPLTIPPMGLWMCPNHPEHHMDASLLTTHSLSERVKLWDKFTVPVDQDAVRLSFFRQCHRRDPPFRYKVKKALRSRIRVPGAVKAHYKDPPDLLPRALPFQSIFPPHIEEEPSPCTSIPAIEMPLPAPSVTTTNELPHPSLPAITYGQSSDECSTTEVKKELELPEVEEPSGIQNVDSVTKEYSFNDLKPSQEERDCWLAGLLKMQSSIIKYMTTNGTVPVPISCNSGDNSDSTSLLQTSKQNSSNDVKPVLLNGDLSPPSSKPEVIVTESHVGQIPHSTSPLKKNCIKNLKKHKTLNNIAKRKRLAPSDILSDTLAGLEGALRQRVEENADVPLSSLDRAVVDVLAMERLKQIMEPQRPPVVYQAPPLAARALICPLIPDIKLKDFSPNEKYSNAPVSMTFRILNIGKGSHNHVNLELYGRCNFVSAQHAVITFDEATGRYELLNYSEFDTIVDGVSYVCDFSDRTLSCSGAAPILQQVREIIAERKGQREVRSQEPSSVKSNKPGKELTRCECRMQQAKGSRSETRKCGWEGAAVLHHGSVIKFGCLKFVFSIVEEANRGDWSKDILDIYDKFIMKEMEESDKDDEESEESSRAEVDSDNGKSKKSDSGNEKEVEFVPVKKAKKDDKEAESKKKTRKDTKQDEVMGKKSKRGSSIDQEKDMGEQQVKKTKKDVSKDSNLNCKKVKSEEKSSCKS